MFCPNCGQKAVDGAKFCFGCGSSLNFVQQPEAPQQPEVPQQPETPKPVYEAPQQPVYEAPQQPVYQAPQQPNYYSAPQQPYSPYAQPYALAQKPKSKKALWIILAVVALLAAAAVVVFVLLGGKSDDPETAAEEFIEAAFEGDLDTVESYLYGDFKEDAEYYVLDEDDHDEFELLSVEAVSCKEMDESYVEEYQEYLDYNDMDGKVEAVYRVKLEATAEIEGEKESNSVSVYIVQIDGELYFGDDF